MYLNRKYPSKILLTGEYTVLLGYPALAIPWFERYAQWDDDGIAIDDVLQNFYNFIKDHPFLKDKFLMKEWWAYIERGGYFKSNIPFGYGLGSSGSFCAGVLDRFGIEYANSDGISSNIMDENTEGISDIIKKHDVEIIYPLLKAMECFFHGQSSGLDPMISFYNRAIQACNGIISFPQLETTNLMTKHGLYLVDSKLNRNTQHLVSDFKESIQNASYLSSITTEIVPLNDAFIQSLLKNDTESFEETWKALSKASLIFFQQMIPESFQNFWKAGLQSKSYFCKLCGAGGGGLFLAKVLDENAFKKQLDMFGFEIFG